MSFVEVQFPSDISYGATGGPMFLTDVVATVSGHEQRNSKWSQARARYNVASGVKTETQWQALIAFFRARRGKAVGFRFKDWGDFKAVNQPLLSLGGEERPNAGGAVVVLCPMTSSHIPICRFCRDRLPELKLLQSFYLG